MDLHEQQVALNAAIKEAKVLLGTLNMKIETNKRERRKLDRRVARNQSESELLKSEWEEIK